MNTLKAHHIGALSDRIILGDLSKAKKTSREGEETSKNEREEVDPTEMSV